MYLQKCAINKEIRTMSTTTSKRCRSNGLSDQWAVGRMGCRTTGKLPRNITPSVDPDLNIVRIKVCIGDLTNSRVLIQKVARLSQQNN